MSDRLRDLFPGLRTTSFWVTSPADPDYNCVAWAANDSNNYWWPVGKRPRIYWPVGAPQEESLAAFVAIFQMLGYASGTDEWLETGVQKVALFVDAEGVPTHAARQLPSGRWASKLGKMEDIEHDLRALEGDIYGTVALVPKRSMPGAKE